MNAKPTIWLTAREHLIGRSAATRRRQQTLARSAPSPHTQNAPEARKRPGGKTARFRAPLTPPPITADRPPAGMAVSVPGWQSAVAIWQLLYWGSAIAGGLLLTELIWG